MTMRTYTYYICPNGHRGHELFSQNDQPYSKSWERTTYDGVREVEIADGKHQMICAVCNQPVTVTNKPKT